MRRTIKLASLMVLGLSLVMSCLPARVSADTSDFIITEFSADETLSRSDPQGELHVVEHISVNFHDFNHGLLRAVPQTYKRHSLQLHVNSVTSPSGAPATYSTSTSNGNTVLKIGDPNRTVTGPQQYVIDYTLRNVITFYPDHDELYFDVNGDQWPQNFDSVKLTLHIPNGAVVSKAPACFAGQYGAANQACTITSSNQTIQAATTSGLPANSTLTYVVGFQTGYFADYGTFDLLGEHLATIAKVAVLPLFTVLVAGTFWWRRGRDDKGRGVIIPEYSPPTGLSPLEVGTLYDFKVDNKDISATIIDLAVRGYIKIIEQRKDRLIGKDNLSYTLELTKADYAGLSPHEVSLLNALFTTSTVGAQANISAIKNSLFSAATRIREQTEAQLTAAGYFKSNPLKANRWFIGVVVIAFLIVFYGGQLVGLAFAASIVLSGIIAFVFGRYMAARSATGVAAKEHIEGLKLYLQTAEADRIKMLQSPGAPYAANAGEPVKTVELFEKLLPYAMVLGVEKAWAGQFEQLYTQPPGWYSGSSLNAFSAGYLVGSLNDGISPAVNQAFSAPSSSSSSGFGGGGFSGGGGGGGGGGGW